MSNPILELGLGKRSSTQLIDKVISIPSPTIRKDIQSSLIELKERLTLVSDQKEILKIKETMNEINILLSQQGQETNNVLKFENSVNVQDKISWIKMTKKKIKIDQNLQSLYLFYILQYPQENDHSDKKTIDNSVMNLSMFMMFVKQYYILGQDIRKVGDQDDLERKRRGIIDKIESKLSHSILKIPSKQETLQNYSFYKEKLKQSYLAQYQHVESRHKWWNDDEFYRYYNPQHIDQPKQYKTLSTSTLMQIFKKNAFQGKTASYEQFLIILSVIARHIYPLVENQDLTLKLYIEVLSLHKTKKMKRHQINIHHAFNITEQIGYRYETQKLSTFESKQSLHNTHGRKYQSSDNKVLLKIKQRVNEVETLESDRNKKVSKLHDNFHQLQLNNQKRVLQRLK